MVVLSMIGDTPIMFVVGAAACNPLVGYFAESTETLRVVELTPDQEVAALRLAARLALPGEVQP